MAEATAGKNDRPQTAGPTAPPVLFAGLWLYFLLSYLRPQDLFPPFAAVRPVLIITGLIAIGLLLSRSQRSLYIRGPYFIALFLFTASMFWTIPFSYYRGNSLEASLDFLKIVLSCLLITNIVDSFKRLLKIFFLITSVLLFLAVDIIVKYLAGEGHGVITGLVGGHLRNPNDLAVTFVLFLPMIYYHFLESRNRLVKLASLGFFGLMLFAILGTQSRGGILGAALVVALLLLKTDRKLIGLMAAGMTVLLVLALAPNDALDRLWTIPNYQDDTSALGRVHYYEASVDMLLARPLTGVGIDAWPTAYAKDFRHPADDTRRWPDPHSSVFQILAELGLPGFLIFLTLVGITFRSLKRLERQLKARTDAKSQLYFVRCLRTGVIGFLCAATFQTFSYFPVLYETMAFVVVLQRLNGSPRAHRSPTSTLPYATKSPALIRHRQLGPRRH